MAGVDYGFVAATKDKIENSKPFRAQVEGLNVYIVRTGDPVKDAWIEPYLSELSVFPAGKYDDQVDGSSVAFNELVATMATLVSASWGRR
jgi:predicted phage terminase large subunit-like protein